MRSRGWILLKILIVNRGEIASRAIAACKSLGVRSVLFCTPADQETRAFEQADEVYLTTSSEASQSYTNLAEISVALKSTGAAALYAGYGFLSEKAELAQLCESLNIIFIGPPSLSLTSLAHKGGARELARACGLATLEIQPPFKDEHFPLLMKVAHGGGGRGHALVEKPADLARDLAALTEKSSRLFLSTEIIYERFVAYAKHVELQIFADRDKVHFLGTRDCSVQRNFQKLIEEGPADPSVWQALQPSFVAINSYLKKLNYLGPGTLEFLFLPASKELFFLEINCRIQVEHTVTEELCQVDLVLAQISNALNDGYRFPVTQSKGHAIELRLYAEQPANGFLPSVGKIQFMQLTSDTTCRFDMSYRQGHSVSNFYDPLIGKLIVHADTREQCLKKFAKLIPQLTILGIHTNLDYLNQVMANPVFVKASHSVQWLPAAKQESKAFFQTFREMLANIPAVQLTVQSKEKKERTWKISHRL